MYIKEALEGQHNFDSFIFELMPIIGDFHRTMEVKFYTWYAPETLPQHCQEDWNKGGGIGNYLSLNNQSAAMLGWRCGIKPFTWDVCLFINTPSKSFWTTLPITTSPEDLIKVFFSKKGSSMDVSLHVNGKPECSITINDCAKVMRRRNAWHGGQCPCRISSCRLYQKWLTLI